MKVAIWLDDMRDPTSRIWADRIDAHAEEAEQVIWAKTAFEFKHHFQAIHQDPDMELVAVFFDNDLGGPAEGRHAFNWMEKYVRHHDLGSFTLDAQTANPAARKELLAGFGSLRRFWGQRVSSTP